MLIGFDLDMTLVNTARGITITLQTALAEAGVTLADDAVWPYIGISLADTVEALAPGVDGPTVVARYRELYPSIGLATITPLPGALATVDLLRAEGHQVAVVSAKIEPAVRIVLAAVGLEVDQVVGDLFAEAKGAWLLAHQAAVYVGDHPGDMRAAQVSGAIGVGVSTGPHTPDDLWRAGADVVLPGLESFAPWWAQAASADANGRRFAIPLRPGAHRDI